MAPQNATGCPVLHVTELLVAPETFPTVGASGAPETIGADDLLTGSAKTLASGKRQEP
jgi:hypothetical protein